MKRFLLLALALVLTVSVAVAEDLGVQVIGGQQSAASDPLSLDDIQMGNVYMLDGAIAVPNEFMIADCFAQFTKDNVSKDKYIRTYTSGGYDVEGLVSAVYSYSNSEFRYRDYRYANAEWCDSGDGAQFAWLRMDITCTKQDISSLSEQIEVKLVYNNEFEFGGWIRQINYADTGKSDYSDGGIARYGFAPEAYPQQIVYHPDNAPAVGYMATGNYVLGCTLPNYVVDDAKSPLSMIITIDGNEITYNIRK